MVTVNYYLLLQIILNLYAGCISDAIDNLPTPKKANSHSGSLLVEPMSPKLFISQVTSMFSFLR